MCDHVQEAAHWKSMFIWNDCLFTAFIFQAKVITRVDDLMPLCPVVFPLVQAREDGVPWQKHAGPASTGTLHHGETWSIFHRAVDGWIRLPKPYQVSTFMILLHIAILRGNCEQCKTVSYRVNVTVRFSSFKLQEKKKSHILKWTLLDSWQPSSHQLYM